MHDDEGIDRTILALFTRILLPITDAWKLHARKARFHWNGLVVTTGFTHDVQGRGLCRQLAGADNDSRHLDQSGQGRGLL